MQEEEIIKLCKWYGIKNYRINDDMTIDVNGDVDLYKKITDKTIPLVFNKVTGTFNCGRNYLTTLKCCPKYVGGGFYIFDNNFLTLENVPNHIGNFFNLSNTRISTLKHLPVNFYIGGNIHLFDIDITDAEEYGKLFFGHVGGFIETDFKHLTEFLNENINPPKKDLPKLLSELRKIKL